MINAIVATDRHNLIGIDNKLPWHRPADLKNFKKLTFGHTVIMGRKTFHNIGKPLSNRNNIILTHQEIVSWNPYYKGWSRDRAFARNSVDETFELLEDLEPQEVFIIGGMQIYKEFAPYVERIYMTIIDQITPLVGNESIFFPWPAFTSLYDWKIVHESKLGPDDYFIIDREK